jgi:chromate reductase
MIKIISATSGNNLKLAGALEAVVKELGGTASIINLEELNLPLYTPPLEKEGMPEKAAWLTEQLTNSKGTVWLAPEYNGSLPPVVSNAVAWVSRAGGENWRDAFNYKYAVVGTHSGGGGAKLVGAVKQQLEHLGTTVLARSIITNYQKELNPESAKTILSQLMELSK